MNGEVGRVREEIGKRKTRIRICSLKIVFMKSLIKRKLTFNSELVMRYLLLYYCIFFFNSMIDSLYARFMLA